MKRTNFYYLFVALLLFLIAIPLVDDLGIGGAPIIRGLVFSGLLVIGVWSLRGGGRYFSLGMIFVIGDVISTSTQYGCNPWFFSTARCCQ